MSSFRSSSSLALFVCKSKEFNPRQALQSPPKAPPGVTPRAIMQSIAPEGLPGGGRGEGQTQRVKKGLPAARRHPSSCREQGQPILSVAELSQKQGLGLGSSYPDMHVQEPLGKPQSPTHQIHSKGLREDVWFVHLFGSLGGEHLALA